MRLPLSVLRDRAEYLQDSQGAWHRSARFMGGKASMHTGSRRHGVRGSRAVRCECAERPQGKVGGKERAASTTRPAGARRAASSMRTPVSGMLSERCWRVAPRWWWMGGGLGGWWRWPVAGQGRGRRGWRPLMAGRRHRQERSDGRGPLRLAHARGRDLFVWLITSSFGSHPPLRLAQPYTYPYMSLFDNLPPASQPNPLRVTIHAPGC